MCCLYVLTGEGQEAKGIALGKGGNWVVCREYVGREGGTCELLSLVARHLLQAGVVCCGVPIKVNQNVIFAPLFKVRKHCMDSILVMPIKGFLDLLLWTVCKSFEGDIKRC